MEENKAANFCYHDSDSYPKMIKWFLAINTEIEYVIKWLVECLHESHMCTFFYTLVYEYACACAWWIYGIHSSELHWMNMIDVMKDYAIN